MKPVRPLPATPPELLQTLAPLERLHYRAAWRFNQEPFKRFMALLQYTLGSIFIRSVTARRTRVFGMEHVAQASLDQPLLLVANHRSYFDMFVVSSEIFRHTHVRRHMYFPIMGTHYYQSWSGILINSTMGFWTMFPPLFAKASHKDIDRHSLDTLVGLASQGDSTMIGIHPEGGRNTDPDPYTLRRVQPGTGRIIYAARPQVIPAFIVGLENTLWDQIAANWRATVPIRIHFGAPLDLTALYALPPKGSTYKTITDFVMDRVRDLMEQDRALYGGAAAAAAQDQNLSA
jgi:1-acyl-sn-glycerol-3-phosphate acyltransferase